MKFKAAGLEVNVPHLAVALCLCLLLLDVRALVKAQFGVARSEAAKTRELADCHARQLEQDLRLREDAALAEIRSLHTDANRQLADLRAQTLERVDAGYKIVDRRTGEALSEIHGVRADLAPLLGSSDRAARSIGALADTYQEVPAQLGERLDPAWRALEPEVTCRTADGSGYGGCWHGRITAVLGETAKAGGVFVQQFPALATSVTGIAADAHGFADKYVMPHPLTPRQKVWMGFRAASGIGIGLTRAGVF